jgi:hypothetical protein
MRTEEIVLACFQDFAARADGNAKKQMNTVCVWYFCCCSFDMVERLVEEGGWGREGKGRGAPTSTIWWSSTGSRKRQCHDFLVLSCEKNHETKDLLRN